VHIAGDVSAVSKRRNVVAMKVLVTGGAGFIGSAVCLVLGG